jgi:uncharacterized protein
MPEPTTTPKTIPETTPDWVSALQLQPHPEGGFFRETYRSSEAIPPVGLPNRFQNGTAVPTGRAFATAIYYLLQGEQFSALHRIKSDEFWHFYAGTGLTVEIISPTGEQTQLLLGANPTRGQVFQGVVLAGSWFGARVTDGQGYALVGCTVAPGFDFADFEMARRQELLTAFPQHEAVILQLTRA